MVSVDGVQFRYRPVGWVGLLVPGGSSRFFRERRLCYEDAAAGESEAQYHVDGAGPIVKVSSNNRGAITYYYGSKGLSLDPLKMSSEGLAAKARVDAAWAQARETAAVQ